MGDNTTSVNFFLQMLEGTKDKVETYVQATNALSEHLTVCLNSVAKELWNQQWQMKLLKAQQDYLYQNLQTFKHKLSQAKKDELDTLMRRQVQVLHDPPPELNFCAVPFKVAMENFGFSENGKGVSAKQHLLHKETSTTKKRKTATKEKLPTTANTSPNMLPVTGVKTPTSSQAVALAKRTKQHQHQKSVFLNRT